MENPVLRKISDYWDGLRAGRLAPNRSEIDPRQLEFAIESVFILEKHSELDVRFRFSGRRVIDLIGRETRGLAAHMLVAGNNRPLFDVIVNKVLALPGRADLTLCAADSPARSREARLMLLPLYAEDGAMTRVLGCLQANALHLDCRAEFCITDYRLDELVAGKSGSAGVPMPGFQQEAAVFEAQSRPALVQDIGPALRFRPWGKPVVRPTLKLVKSPGQSDH